MTERIPITEKTQPELHIREMSIGHEVPTDKPMFEGIREIEFYSWDWDYEDDTKIFKPEVFVDKDGVQIRKMPPGKYIIAVQAIDNDGLEVVEAVRLKINGGIMREKV